MSSVWFHKLSACLNINFVDFLKMHFIFVLCVFSRELVEAQQAMRTQILEEMLGSVLMTLDEQFFTSQALHSSVMAQLQTFYAQVIPYYFNKTIYFSKKYYFKYL